MRALLINAVCGIRSTGRICTDIAKKLETEGFDVKIAYGRESVPKQFLKYAVRIGKTQDVYWHALMSKCFDQRGYWSRRATKRFLKWAEQYDPDLLWLHNIHDYYINIEMLFEWIKSRPQMRVKWTQHDCWAFTGGCMHFIIKNCFQWKKECKSCPKGRARKIIRIENSNFIRKKNAFTGVSQMEIIAVSKWIESLICDSFLKEYPIKVIYNDIDKSVFKATYGEFRERYNLVDKKVILGVATSWNESKGIYDFYKLAELLDKKYSIVLVGLSDKQIKRTPSNIIALPQTNSVRELAEIYTSADVFVILSKEETFGMTTLEALSCGTPSIVYENTACEEIAKLYGGTIVEQSLSEVKKSIEKICELSI